MMGRTQVRRIAGLSLIALALLGLGGCDSDSAAAGDDVPAEGDSPEGLAVEQTPAAWQEFTTSDLVPGWEMRLDHPARVEINEIDGGLTLRYIGPESPPASEITDGYYISITPIEGQSLDDWVSDRGLSGVDTVDWNGNAARRWSTESELDGTAIPHLGLPAGAAGSPVPLDIAINVSGDVEGRYHEEVDRILTTMEWTEESR